jgi:hypothetical protein
MSKSTPLSQLPQPSDMQEEDPTVQEVLNQLSTQPEQPNLPPQQMQMPSMTQHQQNMLYASGAPPQDFVMPPQPPSYNFNTIAPSNKFNFDFDVKTGMDFLEQFNKLDNTKCAWLWAEWDKARLA